jgi:AraC-like DNA-binding protein
MVWSDLRVHFHRGAGGPIRHRKTMGWQTLPFYRFVRVVGGAATYDCVDGEVPVREGDLILIQATARHITVHETLRLIHLPFLLLDGNKMVNSLDGLPAICRFDGEPADRRVLDTAFDDGRRLLATQREIERARLHVRVMLSVFISSRANAFRNHVSVPARIREVATRLAMHPEERMGVPAMADIAGVSCSQFTRIFRRWYGCSPARYAIEKRIEAACQLMEAEQLSVKETSYSLGYDNPFAFSRQFRKVRGYPPSRHEVASTPL